MIRIMFNHILLLDLCLPLFCYGHYLITFCLATWETILHWEFPFCDWREKLKIQGIGLEVNQCLGWIFLYPLIYNKSNSVTRQTEGTSVQKTGKFSPVNPLLKSSSINRFGYHHHHNKSSYRKGVLDFICIYYDTNWSGYASNSFSHQFN